MSSPLRPRRSSVLAFFLGSALVACATIEPAPPPLKPHGAAPPPDTTAATATTAAPTTTTAGTDDHVRKGALAPRVNVEGVEDGHEQLAQAILAASKVPMAECRVGGGGGTVRVRVKSDRRSASFDIEPGSSIDENVRHCVLEALSTIDVPDTLSQASPSSAAPKGFSSVITVQW